MTPITPTTELEAINTMLSCISEAPINDLETTGSASVYTARNILAEVSRTVQQRGWHFNSEEDYPLVRNTDNELVLPQNTFRVSVSRDHRYDFDVTQRGNRLYDRRAHRFTFEKDLKVDIVLCLPFTDLPEAARKYILITATRTFQGRIQGSETVYKFTTDELVAAMRDMMDAENDTAKHNIFTGSYSMIEMVDRFV